MRDPARRASSLRDSGARLRSRGSGDGFVDVRGVGGVGEWLGGVEPAWTVLEPSLSKELMAEPPFHGGALHLVMDLAAHEIARSVLVRNALALLGVLGDRPPEAGNR